jgi:hypothetical protein
MIKKTIALFFVLIFLLLKKIFIKENRVPNKTMDNFSNKLHSIFLFSSFLTLYLLWFDITINNFEINQALYILLFLQIVIIVRYFNPQMLVVKNTQVKILKIINKISLLFFIFNWIIFSFGFAFSFILILLLNNLFYLFIINQINKQKQNAEFKKQFGEGDYTKEDIVKKHIVNLFESDLDIKNLTKSDIKKQYRNMAKRYHPDVYKGNKKDKFSSIHLSYKFLIDLIK